MVEAKKKLFTVGFLLIQFLSFDLNYCVERRDLENEAAGVG